jgi:hypothetical protein
MATIAKKATTVAKGKGKGRGKAKAPALHIAAVLPAATCKALWEKFDAADAASKTFKVKDRELAEFVRDSVKAGALLDNLLLEGMARHVSGYMFERDEGFRALSLSDQMDHARYIADGTARKAKFGNETMLGDLEKKAAKTAGMWKMSFLNRQHETITGEKKVKDPVKQAAGAAGAEATSAAKGAQTRDDSSKAQGELEKVRIRPAITGAEMSPAQYVEFIRHATAALLSTMKAFNAKRKTVAPCSGAIEKMADAIYASDNVEALNAFACLPSEPAPKAKGAKK